MPEPSPNGMTPLQTLKPSTQGMDSTMMATRLTMTALPRDQPSRSIANERMFSKTATTVVMAAKDMNRKNRLPQSCPSGISLKMLGRVTNTRPGPAPGSMPNAKQDGMMIRPAMTATNVSSAVMLTASPVMERSLDR